jgi:hypothetical protein
MLKPIDTTLLDTKICAECEKASNVHLQVRNVEQSCELSYDFLKGVAGLVSLLFACNVFAANPLVAPAPAVKIESAVNRPASSPPPLPQGGAAAVGPNIPVPVPFPQSAPQNNNQSAQPQMELPPEKWLAQAVVTSTVGDRASIVVPLSLNEALATNSNFQPQFGGQNPQVGNSFQNAPQQRNPALGNINQPLANTAGMFGQQVAAAQANQPQVAVQQTRQEILYVRNGAPFFFKGERFSVEVSGREVMIYRPINNSTTGSKKSANVKENSDRDTRETRDIVFIGTVSSTEMSRRAVVGSFAAPDPAVLKRITPTYGSSSSNTTPTGNGSGANTPDSGTGGVK